MKQLSFYLYLALLSTLPFSTNCSHINPTPPSPLNQKGLQAVAWLQTSGEARALCYQAFNLARMRLDQELRSRQKKSGKTPAIVVDVDETVLDNSPYQVKLLRTGNFYPLGWREWVGEARALALPGSVEFLSYASSQGVAIFYITNRKRTNLQATLKNLKDVGFPIVKERVLMRTTNRSKEKRRQQVLKDHHILLLMGDNLGDFHHVFDYKSVNQRNLVVDNMSREFGKKFIVLPNPLYGDWEAALYNYNYKQPDQEKYQLIQQSLRSR